MTLVCNPRDGVRISVDSAQSLARGVLKKGWLVSVGGGSSAHLPQYLTPGHFSHTGQPHAPCLVFRSYKTGIRAPFFQPWILRLGEESRVFPGALAQGVPALLSDSPRNFLKSWWPV